MVNNFDAADSFLNNLATDSANGYAMYMHMSWGKSLELIFEQVEDLVRKLHI